MNKTTSPLFLDGLDPARQEVFKTLKAFSSDFVLAGGTALMLQIGHRKSYDFDLFTVKPFPKKTFAKFKRIFGSSISELKTDEIMLLKGFVAQIPTLIQKDNKIPLLKIFSMQLHNFLAFHCASSCLMPYT